MVTCPARTAYAKITAFANAPCDSVRSEMLARIHGQPKTWHDPHNNGTYAVLDASGDVLQLQRETGNHRYTDKFNFVFVAPSDSTCTLLGCSESQVTSVADFGTNYCNLRMLYCGSADGCPPVDHDFTSDEQVVSTSSPAAQHDLKLCLKV